MKPLSMPVVASLVGLLALVSSGCAAADTATSATVTSSTVQPDEVNESTSSPTTQPAPVDLPDGWLDAVVSAVDAFHEARSASASLLTASWIPGPSEYDTQLRLFETDHDTVRTLRMSLPDTPSVESVDPYYEQFLAATESLAVDTGRVAGTLRENEAAVRASLDVSNAKAADVLTIDDAINDHAGFYDLWTRACFDLQAELGDIGQAPIDCIGVERSFGDLGQAVDPELVSVSVECTRGGSVDELGFDTTHYPWLVGLANETSWIRSVVTIQNGSEQHVQLDPGFRVQYLDRTGLVIAERDWDEPFPPAFHAAPGQTAHRTGYAFEGLTYTLGLRGDAPSTKLLENVFSGLNSCAVVGEPVLRGFDANPHLDVDLATHIDVTCASTESIEAWTLGNASGFVLADAEVTAPDDENVWFEWGVEYVDADGNRLGMGGSRDGPVRLAAGESRSIIGDSVTYTMVDPGAVADCRLHSVQACPDDCGPRQ